MLVAGNGWNEAALITAYQWSLTSAAAATLHLWWYHRPRKPHPMPHLHFSVHGIYPTIQACSCHRFTSSTSTQADASGHIPHLHRMPVEHPKSSVPLLWIWSSYITQVSFPTTPKSDECSLNAAFHYLNTYHHVSHFFHPIYYSQGSHWLQLCGELHIKEAPQASLPTKNTLQRDPKHPFHHG